MREYGIGAALPRIEDDRFVRGEGRYTEDIRVADAAHMHVVRSPHANARILSIDAEQVRRAPGVLAVITGADLHAAGVGHFSSWMRYNKPDGSPNFQPPYAMLAREQVRHVGEGVAAIVAETAAAARDAAELIDVSYEVLEAASDISTASVPEAPAIWPECPDNVCIRRDLGDREGVDKAIAGAAHVTRVSMVISRVTGAPIEPRSAIGRWDRRERRFVLETCGQAPHATRAELARILGVSETELRIVLSDVGGSFGTKGMPYPELILVLLAARRIGRPVRWTADRVESFLGDHHARDCHAETELALDSEGRFLGLRVTTKVNMGAYLSASGLHCAYNNLGGIAGVYRIPAIHADASTYFSNSNPTAAYRGAGRPEASMMIERTIDAAAAELGLDPAELRLRNLIDSSQMPYDTGFIFTYDTGEFRENQLRAMEMAGWKGFPGRRQEARRNGRLRGIGMAHVIEAAGGINEEMVEIRFETSGHVRVHLGTHSQGQGHDTIVRQVVAETLGLPPEQVSFRDGDTDLLPFGRGTGGSRVAIIAGHAISQAAKRIVAQGTQIAAALLEAPVEEIEFSDGMFRAPQRNRTLSLTEIARASFDQRSLPPGVEPGLMSRLLTKTAGPTFPNGCHIAEVEIDEGTGHVEIIGYWVVEDVGRVINPKIVKGQVQGGVVQGIGQALGEFIGYDQTGQILNASFMDYQMPRARDVPWIEIESREVLSTVNELGIKGAGEGGTVGALPAVMNAICDALAAKGIRHFDMPATPLRLWKAMNGLA